MENSSVSSALSLGVPDGVAVAKKYCHAKKYSVTRSQKLIYYLTCIVYLEL